MKKVSVVIPIYNVKNYIEKAVDSVLKQTYSNLEIILIDDGSTDGSSEICDALSCSDSRVVVFHQENSGVSKTRNFGIQQSTGDYIFFLDGDDYIDETSIEKLVSKRAEGVFPILGYQLDIDGKGIVEAVQHYGQYENVHSYLLDFNKYFATKFSFVWGKLFDSSIIKKYNINFPQNIMLGEDMLFNLKYYSVWQGPIQTIEHNGYFYRQTGSNSLSKKFDERMFDWNEKSYTELKNYLSDNKALTGGNYAHLMKNILGNYLYCFRLIALNEGIPLLKKRELISKYSKTLIFKESCACDFRKRLDVQLYIFFLMNKCIFLYIFIEIFKKNIIR